MEPVIVLPKEPEPWYIKGLESQNILFDVNALLRGVLFKGSYSRELIDNISQVNNAKITICPHIKDVAITKLRELLPSSLLHFTSKLEKLIADGIIKVVPNGDLTILPPDMHYDEKDDDIVMATALSSGCTYIVTLDYKMAETIGSRIDVLFPSDPDKCAMNMYMGGELKLYCGAETGSMIIDVEPQYAGKYRKRGRRYVFCADSGLSCWLNENTWKYQFGFVDQPEPLYTINELQGFAGPVRVGISYDCSKSNFCFGIGKGYDGNKTFFTKEFHHIKMDKVINERISILNNAFRDESFNGFFTNYVSSAQNVREKGLIYAMNNYGYYQPHDVQKFPLTDETFNRNMKLENEEFTK